MYKGSLKNGIFSERWKKAKIVTIKKPGTQTWEEVTNYRTNILLNLRRKILERALINNKPLQVFNGVPQQEPVRINSANDHNSRD